MDLLIFIPLAPSAPSSIINRREKSHREQQGHLRINVKVKQADRPVNYINLVNKARYI